MPRPDVPLEAIPLHPLASGASPEERDFARLEREVIHHIFSQEPSRAILMGLHAYDGYLGIVDREEAHLWVQDARRYLEQLAAIDREALSTDRALDVHVLGLKLEEALFYEEDFPSKDLSPFDYLFPIQLAEFTSRDYAPARKRAEAIARQLILTPDFLRTGLTRLKGPLPRPHVTLGLDMLKGMSQHFEEGVAFVQSVAPDLVADARTGKQNSLGVLEEFRVHLEKELPRSDDSYRLGPERFQKLLWVTDGLKLSWQALLAEGQDDLRRNQARLEEIARGHVPPLSVDEVVKRSTDDTPAPGAILDEARQFVDELRDLVVRKDLASLPDDKPCRVEENPPAERAFSQARMCAAGPFEEGAAAPVYRITLPDPTAAPELQLQRLKALNRPALRCTTSHEVYPGHYLQLQHFRSRPASPTRKSFPSTCFTEGWAVYAEKLVVEQESAQSGVRSEIAQLKAAIGGDCLLLTSIAMHAQGRTLEEARDLYLREARSGSLAADRAARRSAFNPSCFSYALGKLRFLDARQAYFERNPKGTLRQFHDRILAHGAPPVGTLRALALDETPA
jgi:hypothetical protein